MTNILERIEDKIMPHKADIPEASFWHLLESRYRIFPSDVQLLRPLLRSLSQFPVYIQHPAFEVLNRVDYC